MSLLGDLLNLLPKHRVFVSFHSADMAYKKELVTDYATQFDGFVDTSVNDGDIDENLPAQTIRQKIRDEFIRDATVTVVLVGSGTWRRKHVDWEIGSAIRKTRNNSRTGLIGILLPTYRPQLIQGMSSSDCEYTENGGIYLPYTIPPRLYKNVESGYAKIYSWNSSPTDLRKWVHEAFTRRAMQPSNAYPAFQRNRPDSASNWKER